MDKPTDQVIATMTARTAWGWSRQYMKLDGSEKSLIASWLSSGKLRYRDRLPLGAILNPYPLTKEGRKALEHAK